MDFKSLIDGGIIVQQSPQNAILKKADFKPAVATHQGKEYRCRRQPTDREYDDLLFGWWVEQGVTSNSVLFVKDGVHRRASAPASRTGWGWPKSPSTRPTPSTPTSSASSASASPTRNWNWESSSAKRENSDKVDIDKETEEARGGLIGAAMVSDAFFPFRDGVDVGIRQGITAIAHAGGSMRDHEVHRGLQRSRPAGGHGLHRPALLQALMMLDKI